MKSHYLLVWIPELLRLPMSALVVGVAITGLAVLILSAEPEFVQLIKDVIYRLVLAGYGEEKILYIMHLYA